MQPYSSKWYIYSFAFLFFSFFLFCSSSFFFRTDRKIDVCLSIKYITLYMVGELLLRLFPIIVYYIEDGAGAQFIWIYTEYKHTTHTYTYTKRPVFFDSILHYQFPFKIRQSLKKKWKKGWQRRTNVKKRERIFSRLFCTLIFSIFLSFFLSFSFAVIYRSHSCNFKSKTLCTFTSIPGFTLRIQHTIQWNVNRGVSIVCCFIRKISLYKYFCMW